MYTDPRGHHVCTVAQKGQTNGITLELKQYSPSYSDVMAQRLFKYITTLTSSPDLLLVDVVVGDDAMPHGYRRLPRAWKWGVTYEGYSESCILHLQHRFDPFELHVSLFQCYGMCCISSPHLHELTHYCSLNWMVYYTRSQIFDGDLSGFVAPPSPDKLTDEQ